MKTIFGLYGSGWRAEFFLRAAKYLPERFEVAGVVTRNADKAAFFTRKFGVKCYETADELLAACKPMFMAVCVNRTASVNITLNLLHRGIPVLMETPPAPDMAALARFQAAVPAGAVLEIAEQYPFQPLHAARLAFIKTGKIGAVCHAHISFTQGYHAIALMRKYLGVSFEKAEITAKTFEVAGVAGPGRGGEPTEEKMITKPQTVAVLDFGGKTGVFNFEGDQHRSWIRSQIIQVKGTHGEIFNNKIKYLNDYKTPIETEFIRKNLGENENLEGYDLKGIMGGGEWLYRNPYQGSRLADDEIAVAACLDAMVNRVNGGPSFYGLPEAARDLELALAIERAATNGVREIIFI